MTTNLLTQLSNDFYQKMLFGKYLLDDLLKT